MEKQLTLSYINSLPVFEVKDPISAMTHFIAFWASLFGMPLLLIHASIYRAGTIKLISFAIFMLSMILLYAASSAYHTFHISEHADKVLKKIDHMMIFILIAGSYTPVCTIVLPKQIGIRILILIWGIAVLGIGFKAFWVTCPKWLSSVIYISMGWVALLAFRTIYENLPLGAFFWLVSGGIIYTIGGVIYAMKFQLFRKYIPGFGAHELFHVFVMAGSLCHYMMMFQYLVKM